MYLPLLLLSVSIPGADSPITDSTLEAIVQSATATSARIQRLSADFYTTTHFSGNVHVDRTQIAYAPGRCFGDYMHFTGPGTPPWHDPERFQFWIGPQMLAFKPFERSAFPDNARGVREYWEAAYRHAIGWHPNPDPFRDIGDEPFFVDEICSSPELGLRILVDAEQEVDSIPCVVIETKSGSDRLCLAPTLNYAVVQRLIVRGKLGELRKKTYSCRKFKEVEQGLWLPSAVDATFSNVTDGAETVLRTFHIDVTHLAVNDQVPDALFDFHPPRGTIFLGAEGRPIAFVPGGEDLLDEWGALCVSLCPPTSSQSQLDWPLILSLVSGSSGLFVFIGVAVRCTTLKGPTSRRGGPSRR